MMITILNLLPFHLLWKDGENLHIKLRKVPKTSYYCVHIPLLCICGWWIGMGVWELTCNSNEITIFLQNDMQKFILLIIVVVQHGYLCDKINKICILMSTFVHFFKWIILSDIDVFFWVYLQKRSFKCEILS